MPEANVGTALLNSFTTNSYGSTKMLALGVDYFFLSQQVLLGIISQYKQTSEFWTTLSEITSDNGQYKCPMGSISIGTFSKQAYRYPYVSYKTMLPTLNAPGQLVEFGIETDARIGSGIATFRHELIANTELLYIRTGGSEDYAGAANITLARPVNYKSVRHAYTIVTTKNQIEFYIDNKLVGVAIHSANIASFMTTNPVNYPPYAILGTELPITPNQSVAISCRGNGTELIFPLSPTNVWFSDGESNPSRVYPLYQNGTSTLFSGSIIVAGSVVSHPIPIFGFEGKTIYFQANQAGTLLIEILDQTNTWRTYDTVTTVANTLTSYTITAEAILSRITFTPTAFPCTINSSEAVLR